MCPATITNRTGFHQSLAQIPNPGIGPYPENTVERERVRSPTALDAAGPAAETNNGPVRRRICTGAGELWNLPPGRAAANLGTPRAIPPASVGERLSASRPRGSTGAARQARLNTHRSTSASVRRTAEGSAMTPILPRTLRRPPFSPSGRRSMRGERVLPGGRRAPVPAGGRRRYGVAAAVGVARPPPVTGASRPAAGGRPHVSLLAFQSGTDGSGQSRTPVTGPFTATTASKRSPWAQTCTGRRTSAVDPSAKARRISTGKGMDVCLVSGTVAYVSPSRWLVVTAPTPMSSTSFV